MAGNDDSRGPRISDDGSVVAFRSFATDLTAPSSTMGRAHIYHRNIETENTVRASSKSDGNEPNESSGGFALSGNGEWVAFDSSASDIVKDDLNMRRDIFLVEVGDLSTVERISGGLGASESDGSSDIEDITPNGNFVVFSSIASNLVTPPTGTNAKLYRYEKESGQTLLLTLDINGGDPSEYCETASVSADGRYVAFESDADDLVVDDTNDDTDVFLHDVVEGTTIIASRNSDGVQGDGYNYPGGSTGALSDDGRYLVFRSFSTNLADITNFSRQVYVRDLWTSTTELISENAEGVEADSGASGIMVLSGDGNHVAFSSSAANLVEDDTNMARDVFLWSRPDSPTKAAPDNPLLRAFLLNKIKKLKKKAKKAKKKGKKAKAKKLKKKAKKLTNRVRAL